MFHNYLIKTTSLILLVLVCQCVLAQTIRYVKPGGGGSGSSWNDASGDLQAMINASAAGDQVWVAKGTYVPETTFMMKDSVSIYGGFVGDEGSLAARNPAVNETILKGNTGGTIFNRGLTRAAVLDCFTITGGNSSIIGAGMTNQFASPTVVNCKFLNNKTNEGGGAVRNYNSSPAIINCTFYGNSCYGYGGAILNDISSPVIVNCTISGNSAIGTSLPGGGGICNRSSSPIITNCILWGNSNGEIVNQNGSDPTVSHCNVQGGYTGNGNNNIDADPQFEDAANGVFRLKAGSPCIDAGDNDAYENADNIAGNNSLLNDKDLDGKPRLQGGTIDMGAFEFVSSKPQTISHIADITKTDIDPDFDPGATASSGLPVAYASADTSIAGTYQDGDTWKIKIKKSGTVSITASQPGNDEWAAAPKVSFLLVIKHVPVIRYVKQDGSGNGTSWDDASDDLQAMIDASAAGDQVWVEKGTYVPKIFFRMKDSVGIYGGFAGDENSLAERKPDVNETILQGNTDGTIFNRGLTRAAVLDCFTITGGNSSLIGGGMTNQFASPTVVNCKFLNNKTNEGGGAVRNYNSSPAIINCTFYGNSCYGYGGAILNDISSPVIVNCTISGNSAIGTSLPGGGGICNRSSSPIITNCILWGNSNGEIVNQNGSDPTVSHCNVQGGYTGNGNNNIDADPQFEDAANGVFRLKAGSPCIDAGDNDAYENADNIAGNNSLLNDKDLDGNPRLQGGTIDMGAYEASPLQPQTIDSIANITKTYGDADFEPGATASSGLPVAYASADTSIAGAYQQGGTWKIQIKKAGTVTITASQPGNTEWAAAPDVSFTLTIQKKTVTVEADSLTKVYGNPDPELTYTVTPALVAGDAFTGSLSRNTGNNVGTYAITQGTLALNDNYTINFVSSNLTITPKAITVTADKKSKMFGEQDPELTYTVSPDLVAGDSFSGALSREQGEDVGTYTINQHTLTAGDNYTITYVGSELIITTTTITVTADAKTKTYGDKDPELTYTVSPASAGNALSGDLSREQGTDVGSYAITQGSLTAGSNYTITFVSKNLTITPKAITVTADAKSKMFGAQDPELTYTVSPDLVAGDTFSGALSREQGEDVGTYTINQHTLTAGDNYTITYVGSLFIITPATITVTADAKTKTYGDTDPDLTYTVSPASAGSALTGDLSREQGTDVGRYIITQGSLTANNNYQLKYVGSQLTITPKAITVTAEAKTKTYGDKDPDLTYTVSPALVAGDSFSGALSREQGEEAGTYVINQHTLTAGDNYTITYVGSNLTITPKPITVTADSKTKTYGDKDPALTYSFSPSLVAGDSFSGALSRQPGENAGTYTINQGTLALNNNYTITYNANQLTINKAVLTATAGDKTICFGEQPGSIDIIYSGFKFNDNATSLDKEPRVNIPSINNAGEYALTLSGGSSPNYNFNYVEGKLTVLPTPSGEITQSPTGPGVVSGFNLTAPDGAEYRWSTGETSSGITVRASGSYSVTVTSQQGCSKQFTVPIRFETLSIPNTFSPNGDGINDYWVIPELINYPNAYVIIVNRDGQTVFESKSFTRWDGRYRGNPLPAGVYFYRIRKAPGAEPVTGWLNLLR